MLLCSIRNRRELTVGVADKKTCYVLFIARGAAAKLHDSRCNKHIEEMTGQKMKRRIIAILMIVLSVVAVLPVVGVLRADAADNWKDLYLEKIFTILHYSKLVHY